MRLLWMGRRVESTGARLRGDCSIRIEGYGFSAEEIAACAARQGILSLELELSSTSECTCVNCRDAGGPPRQVLTADEIRELIGQAKSLGCRQVILVDGETEQYPHLEEIVDHLHSEGLRIELFANEVMTPALASFLHGHNVSMSVPVDALAGIDGLPALSALREAGYGEPGNPALAIRISAGEENLDEIPGIWRWARVRGIDPHVQIITPRNGVEHQLKLVSPNPARAMFEELGRIDREEFDRTWTTPPSLIGRSCKRHLYACHVTACGTVFACVGVTIPLGKHSHRAASRHSGSERGTRKPARVWGQSEGTVPDLFKIHRLLRLPRGRLSNDRRLPGRGLNVLESRRRTRRTHARRRFKVHPPWPLNSNDRPPHADRRTHVSRGIHDSSQLPLDGRNRRPR